MKRPSIAARFLLVERYSSSPSLGLTFLIIFSCSFSTPSRPQTYMQDRRPTLTWPRMMPVSGDPPEVVEIVGGYNKWLSQSTTVRMHAGVVLSALLPHFTCWHGGVAVAVLRRASPLNCYCQVPKLWINAEPGALIRLPATREMVRSWPNLKEATGASVSRSSYLSARDHCAVCARCLVAKCGRCVCCADLNWDAQWPGRTSSKKTRRMRLPKPSETGWRAPSCSAEILASCCVET